MEGLQLGQLCFERLESQNVSQNRLDLLDGLTFAQRQRLHCEDAAVEASKLDPRTNAAVGGVGNEDAKESICLDGFDHFILVRCGRQKNTECPVGMPGLITDKQLILEL